MKCGQSETAKNTSPEPRSEKTHRQGRKKWVGIRIPKNLTEATEPDLMMWEWRNAGRSWKDIRTEWERLTGHYPADSTLR